MSSICTAVRRLSKKRLARSGCVANPRNEPGIVAGTMLNFATL